MRIIKKATLKELILSKVSEYDIFRYYLGNFKLGGAIKSPFGDKDDHPSLLIKMGKDGKIFYKDTRFAEYRGDCFTLVMQLFGLTFIEALNKIGDDFGILNGSNKWELIRKKYKQPEEKPKEQKIFKIETRLFTKEDLEWWWQYLISEEDLSRENIFSIKSAWIGDRKLRIGKDELAFAYDFGNGLWKLYFPLRKKRYKWLCNVPINHAYKLENLSKDHNTLICKSLKDYIVCSKIYPYCCGVQNESLEAISQETADYIISHSKGVYYGGDSDITGKKQSKIITDYYNFRHINPPNWYAKQGAKDWADMVKIDGDVLAIKNHFRKKGVI